MAKKKKEKRSGASSKPLDRNDPNLHFDYGEFTLPNGDVYRGDYCAHRSGIIWREGHGIYTTEDGQVYEGLWSDDKLVENKEVLITYPNGVQYQGPLYKNKYHGPGTYVLESKMNVSCEFVQNKPTGIITLVDCQGKLWKGQAGEKSALLLPENVFYLTLNDYKGKGVSKAPLEYEPRAASSSSMKEQEKEVELSDREWEKIIFAKSKMTEDDVDFSDSKWTKNYEEFQQKYGGIKAKIDEGTDLDDDEYDWIEKFKRFKQKRQTKKEQRELERIKEREEVFKLNEKFRSKDFLESCPGVKVLYPQKHPHPHHSHARMGTDMVSIASDDDIRVNDKTNVIYVDSAGEIIPPPPSEVGFASNSSVQSSPQSSQGDEQNAAGEDMTVKFNELVEYSNEQFKRLSNFAACASPLCEPSSDAKPLDDDEDSWENVRHFSTFRDELLMDMKNRMVMEQQYQEEKALKAQEDAQTSKSRSIEGKLGEKAASLEMLKKKDRKVASLVSIGKEETVGKSAALVKTPSALKRSKLEEKVSRCVEQFINERKRSQVARLRMEERQEKPHRHSVAAHTESLTGIPRELLLRK